MERTRKAKSGSFLCIFSSSLTEVKVAVPFPLGVGEPEGRKISFIINAINQYAELTRDSDARRNLSRRFRNLRSGSRSLRDRSRTFPSRRRRAGRRSRSRRARAIPRMHCLGDISLLSRKRLSIETASLSNSAQSSAVVTPDIVVIWASALKAVLVVVEEDLVGADVAAFSGDGDCSACESSQ